MLSKFKNVILFAVIGGVLFFGYTFFIKGDEEQEDLIPATIVNTGIPTTPTTANIQNPTSNADFLTLLLNVKNIKLNDAIFSDPAFKSLSDSSITLTQDGTEGRPNPFAPFGSDQPVSDFEEIEEITISAQDKEAIIAAILNRNKVLSSGNAAQVRAYLKNLLALNPDEAKKMDEDTNANILASAKLIVAASSALTADKLRGPDVTWNMTATKATVTYKKDQNSSVSINLNKVNGSWY